MAPAPPLRFWTIGHSSHAWEHFAGLLEQHTIDVLVDTRSTPYSRFVPHFGREHLQRAMRAAGRRFLWLGNAIGGRPHDPACYDAAGRVLYERVAQTPAFQEAIARLEQGARQFRIALLCAEEDPARCHRGLLITPVLLERGHEVLHIRGDGSLEQAAPQRRESRALNATQPSLFTPAENKMQ